MKKRAAMLLQRKILVCAFFLLYTTVASAADYYVAPNGVTSWASCESETPLSGTSTCSITTALANATAGDTVYFRGGNYYFPTSTSWETPPSGYSVANSGTPESPIVFQAYTGETPVFIGDRGASNEMVLMLRIYNQHDIIIDGFTFEAYEDANGGGAARIPEIVIYTSTDYEMNVTVQNCTFTGGEVSISDNHHMVWIAGSAGNYGSKITIQNNSFNDMWGATTAPANGNGVAAIMPYGYTSSTPNQTHDVVIKNNDFNNVGTAIYFKGGANPASNYDIYNNFFNGVETAVAYGTNGPDNIDFYNNIVVLERVSGSTSRVISAVSADSYQVPAENNTVYNNTIYSTDTASNSQNGVYGHAASIKVHDNIIQLGIQGSGEQSGALYFYTDSGVEWLNNNNFSSSFRIYLEASTHTSIASLEAARVLTDAASPCGASLEPCNNIASDPIFINTSGSMNRVADFALTADSPGYRAGSDGEDMGADVTLVGSSIAPPADTAQIVILPPFNLKKE